MLSSELLYTRREGVRERDRRREGRDTERKAGSKQGWERGEAPFLVVRITWYSFRLLPLTELYNYGGGATS